MVDPDISACCGLRKYLEMTVVIPTDEDVKIFLSTYLADYWYFFDNSSDRAKLVACREAGSPEVIVEQEIWSHYQRLV
jgi:hypothetical protein